MTGYEETITLTEHMLGLRPYVLIEADTDPADGELVLKVSAGSGTQAMIGALPLMLVCTQAAEVNLLTKAVSEILETSPDARPALSLLAEHVGFPMPEAKS